MIKRSVKQYIGGRMITKITNELYISSKETKETVAHNRVKYCINISGVPVEYKVDEVLPLADSYEKNDTQKFIKILESIDKQVRAKNTPVLVMCHAGISRSPAIAALFLFYSHAFKNFDEALEYVCSKNQALRPNPNLVDFIKKEVIPKLKADKIKEHGRLEDANSGALIPIGLNQELAAMNKEDKRLEAKRKK
jgi:hypothetical protein